MILNSSHLRGNKDASKLAAISVVAAGYGGDMDEDWLMNYWTIWTLIDMAR